MSLILFLTGETIIMTKNYNIQIYTTHTDHCEVTAIGGRFVLPPVVKGTHPFDILRGPSYMQEALNYH